MTQACINALVALGLSCPTPKIVTAYMFLKWTEKDSEIVARLRNSTICIHKYEDKPKCIVKIIKQGDYTYHFVCGEPSRHD